MANFYKNKNSYQEVSAQNFDPIVIQYVRNEDGSYREANEEEIVSFEIPEKESEETGKKEEGEHKGLWVVLIIMVLFFIIFVFSMSFSSCGNSKKSSPTTDVSANTNTTLTETTEGISETEITQKNNTSKVPENVQNNVPAKDTTRSSNNITSEKSTKKPVQDTTKKTGAPTKTTVPTEAPAKRKLILDTPDKIKLGEEIAVRIVGDIKLNELKITNSSVNHVIYKDNTIVIKPTMVGNITITDTVTGEHVSITVLAND